MMKFTSLHALLAATAASLILAGCASAPDKKEGQAAPQFVETCQEQGVPAPEWVCDPTQAGGYAEIGQAAPNTANNSGIQRNMALNAGRDNLSRRIALDVKNMQSNWNRVTGMGDRQVAESNFEEASRQISQNTLRNTKQLKRWVAPDGTLFLLVGVEDKAELAEQIKTSLHNDEAQWQQFGSKQALEELDRQVDATFND